MIEIVDRKIKNCEDQNKILNDEYRESGRKGVMEFWIKMLKMRDGEGGVAEGGGIALWRSCIYTKMFVTKMVQNSFCQR